MKRIVASLLLSLGLIPHALAGILPPKQFTKEFAVELHKALPTASVGILEPLRLKVTAPGGKESNVFLDNAYSEYRLDPTLKADVIARYISGLTESFVEHATIDPARIVPIIKDRGWLAEMRLATKSAQGDPGLQQVSEDFNQDLVIVYAEDSQAALRYFRPEDLGKAGVATEKLRELAIGNLKRILPQIEITRGPEVSMLSAGGDFESSLLLIDELWSGSKFEVEGDIVVAIPSRDVLLFTGSRNDKGVNKLRELARETASHSSYSLTDQLFVYRGGVFQRFIP